MANDTISLRFMVSCPQAAMMQSLPKGMAGDTTALRALAPRAEQGSTTNEATLGGDSMEGDILILQSQGACLFILEVRFLCQSNNSPCHGNENVQISFARYVYHFSLLVGLIFICRDPS